MSLLGFVQCDHYLGGVLFKRLKQELAVNRVSIRFLTWGTVLAALLSALLLAGEDAALPDAAPFGGGGQAVPSR